jgi:hypothetical protein
MWRFTQRDAREKARVEGAGERATSLSAEEFSVVFADQFVAFAAGGFEGFAVEDADGAARIFDDLGFLQGAGGLGDAAAVGAEHGGEEVVGEREEARLDAVLRHEEPAGEALFDVVEAIAGGRLRNLHAVDDGEAAEDHEQIGKRLQERFEMSAGDAVGCSGDLDDFAERASAHSEERFEADGAFIADDACFGRLAIGHDDDQGDEAFVEEVEAARLAIAFVQDAVVREAGELEPVAQSAKFAIREREKNAVGNRLSFGAGAFAGVENRLAWRWGDFFDHESCPVSGIVREFRSAAKNRNKDI